MSERGGERVGGSEGGKKRPRERESEREVLCVYVLFVYARAPGRVTHHTRKWNKKEQVCMRGAVSGIVSGRIDQLLSWHQQVPSDDCP